MSRVEDWTVGEWNCSPKAESSRSNEARTDSDFLAHAHTHTHIYIYIKQQIEIYNRGSKSVHSLYPSWSHGKLLIRQRPVAPATGT